MTNRIERKPEATAPFKFNTCDKCGHDNIAVERAAKCSLCGSVLDDCRFSFHGVGSPSPHAKRPYIYP